MFKRFMAPSLILLLSACGGGGSTSPVASADQNIAVRKALANVTPEPAAQNCLAGGARVDSGVDLNGSGVLDANEVTSTQYICSGSNGLNSLVHVTPEPAGGNCQAGGSLVQVGLDANADGVLNVAEVSNSQHLCNDTALATKDYTPPTIDTDAPTVATAEATLFTTTFSDDVELAQGVFAATDPGRTVYFAEGRKTVVTPDRIVVPLGQTVKKLLVAADTSGNVSKKTISVASPATGIQLGGYTAVGSPTIPTGFDCVPSIYGSPFPPLTFTDGSTITSLNAGAAPSWSVAAGYSPYFSISSSNNSSYVSPTAPIPLDSRTVNFSSLLMAGPLFSVYMNGTVVATPSPTTLNVSLTMSCVPNGAPAVNGTTATFTVQMP